MQILSIHHVAILTSNEMYETCKAFYTKILGFRMINETFREERESYKLDLEISGKYQIELFSFPNFTERASFPESKGLRHLAFAVKSVEDAAEWLQENQVVAEALRIDTLTGKKFLFFNDPNGQPLELYEI